MSVNLTNSSNGNLNVSGEMTFETVAQLYRQTATQLRNAGSSITVDLAQVSRSDSAGLALLLEWMRGAQAQGSEITFTNMPAQLLSLAKVSGLEKILPVR